ncbi:uncharacterized protein PRCAT00001863001 [Priceomyces carsonii]|uniref:uncharacterized protein n=1 Tax=Priceomyces carsonii TaxID=28549 RepID=UPI002EDBA387|nr:unnamed protein product [Priceomyces carsonii]
MALAMDFEENWTAIYQGEKLAPGKQYLMTHALQLGQQTQPTEYYLQLQGLHQPEQQIRPHSQQLLGVVNGKGFGQNKFYGPSMLVQQSSYVQVPARSPYAVKQTVLYPLQQLSYDMISPTNYMLVPNSNLRPPQSNTKISPFDALSPNQEQILPNFCERLQGILPAPPLSTAPIKEDVNMNINQKRAKRKSKFTKKQDEMIVELKKKCRSWVEIAELTGVGSYLAARNRYQVIVGQQGNNNSSSWCNEDGKVLRQIVDDAEISKWKFIAIELSKATEKEFTDKECREIIKDLVWQDPSSFGLSERTFEECIREKAITERANEQNVQAMNEEKYAERLLDYADRTRMTFTSSDSQSYYSNDSSASQDDYRSSTEPLDNDHYSKTFL